MAPTKKKLLTLIESESENHLAFLQSLVRTPSANPPGDTRAALAIVEKFIREIGQDVQYVTPQEHAPNLISVVEGQRSYNPRHLVLNGHIDCFPVNDGDQWERDPYSGDLANAHIHGRGVVDMKAGTAASIIAFSYLARLKEHLSGTAVLEVVSDEETGGKFGTRYLLEQDERKDEWRGDVMLNAEPGGIESIRFAEKGTLRMTFTVSTTGGHGAYLHRDEGAIRIASRLIERLVGLEELRGEGMDPELAQYLERDDVKAVADKIMSSGAADSMTKPTVNIGTISGGVKVNMIPSSCTFEADVRLPIGLKAETVLVKIDGLLSDVPEASYVVQEAASNPAAASPMAHPLVGLIQGNAQMVRGHKPLPISSLGATDCKHFRYHGVPSYTYGTSPATMAERNEKVNAQEFLEVVKVHTLTAFEYLQGTC
jgi:succinyl-diaminopimelate desuccinylase